MFKLCSVCEYVCLHTCTSLHMCGSQRKNPGLGPHLLLPISTFPSLVFFSSTFTLLMFCRLPSQPPPSSTFGKHASRRKATAADFLNGHIIELSSEHLCLYPWVSAALSLGQRSLLSQWAMISGHLQLVRVLRISHYWVPCPKWDVYTIPWKAHGMHERGQLKMEELENVDWGWGAEKHCLLDRTWSLHCMCAKHCSCDWLCQDWACNIPWWVEGDSRVLTPSWEAIGSWSFSSFMWLLVCSGK